MRKALLGTLFLVLLVGLAFADLMETIQKIQVVSRILAIQFVFVVTALALVAYYLKKKTISLVFLSVGCLCLLFSMFFPMFIDMLGNTGCGCDNDCLYANHPELRLAIDEIRDANNAITLKDAASVLFILGTISLAKHDPKSKSKRLLTTSIVLFLIALAVFSFYLYKASVIDVVSPSLRVLVLNDPCCISGCM